MHRELQNMSEESLQNLEEIVEMELLTVEDIRNRLDVTEKGKIRQSIQNCKYALEHDPCLKGAICRNEMTCQIDIMKKMPWKNRRGRCRLIRFWYRQRKTALLMPI